MWGLSDEVKSWGYPLPSAQQLHDALFDGSWAPIEWNRIGVHQDVSMRLITEALLFHSSRRQGATFVQGEVTQKQTRLSPPRHGCKYHLFCSPHNAGALELTQELAGERGLKVEVSQDEGAMVQCERMAIYLTSRTWTSGKESTQFATHVEKAMALKVPLFLMHEMPGLGQEDRFACPFDSFFACDQGATPGNLLKHGIYSTIAIALKADEWRKTSMAVLGQALSEDVEPRDNALGESPPAESPSSSKFSSVEELGTVDVEMATQAPASQGGASGGADGEPAGMEEDSYGSLSSSSASLSQLIAPAAPRETPAPLTADPEAVDDVRWRADATSASSKDLRL